MEKLVLFWIMLGVLGFALALAVQMRVMIALVLRRALKAWRPAFEDREMANTAVMLAASAAPVAEAEQQDVAEAVDHLRSVYPNPLAHLRTARRYSLFLPVALVALLALGRIVLGVI